MKILNSITLLFFVIWLYACKEETIFESCVDEQLARLEMVPYTGQEINCEFYLREFEYKGKAYYLLLNHCADMISIPIDCEGNELCQINNYQECDEFFAKATQKEIVGIRL